FRSGLRHATGARKASERTSGGQEVVLLGNLDGYEFQDAPGISQRVDDVLAVNLPMTSARLRLSVVWTGLRSIRCTYSATRVPRTTFTTNFVFFIVSCIAWMFG